MTKGYAVVKNATWIIVCRIVQSVFSLIISMLTARYLGPSNFGTINYASSIVAFFVPLMQLGFKNTLVHEFIKEPEKEGETLGTAIVLNMVSAALCCLGVLAFVAIANAGEKETIIVCFLYSLSLLFQALEMSQYWYQAKLLSQYTAVISVIAYLVVSIFKIFLLATRKNIFWFAVSQAVDYLIISLSLLIIYKRVGRQKLSFSLERGKKMFSVSKHYIVSSMMVTIFAYVGNVFLKFFLDESAVGYYSAAVSCAGMTNFIFAAIIDSARPVILNSKVQNAIYEYRLSALYSIVIVLSVLQCIVITVFAEYIVNIVYGPEYSASILPLRIYCWQIGFSYIGTVRNIWILAEGKQQYMWIINLCGAIVSILFNLTLIPRFGVMGAAVSAVVTQLFTNVILGFIIKPIRQNNMLLLKGVNPNILVHLVKSYKEKIKIDIKNEGE